MTESFLFSEDKINALGNFKVHCTLDSSAQEIVLDMEKGINLGNTFESCGSWIKSSGGVKSFETAWGSPVITEEVIALYAESGFKTLRVPVAWSNMISSDYTISPSYLERVKQVVSWACSRGMYVIINEHWDSGWINTEFVANKDEAMKKYKRIWTQVSETFRDFGVQVIFESQNEELGAFKKTDGSDLWNQWSRGDVAGKKAAYDLANEINQEFVKLVRSSGGNNSKRLLLISGIQTNIDHTCDPMFRMPEDPAKKCAVSVHYYDPPSFAILEEHASWGNATPSWGSDYDLKYLKSNVQKMNENFVQKGIPVIIGEYGCPRKNKEAASVQKYLTSVASEFYKNDMCPVLWDIQTTGSGKDPFMLINRRSVQLVEQETARIIFNLAR